MHNFLFVFDMYYYILRKGPCKKTYNEKKNRENKCNIKEILEYMYPTQIFILWHFEVCGPSVFERKAFDRKRNYFPVFPY